MKWWIYFFLMASLFSENNLCAMSQSESKPLVVLLLGPPGCGKGTVAVPLSRQLKVPHISTGDLFRQHIRQETALGKQAKTFIQLGQLVPDTLVIDIILERLSQEDCEGGYILDGFPRTLAQAQRFEQTQGASHQLHILNFQIADAAIVERITGRLSCAGCGCTYHRLSHPPQVENRCDRCSSTLYQREDDREEVILERLSVYRKQTEPLIAYYRLQKGTLHEINSQQPPEQVLQYALASLPLLSAHP